MIPRTPSIPIPRTRRRGGQSAVELLLLMKLLLIIFVGMYYLFTVTFAAENAHIRAREYALHGATNMGTRAYQTTGTTVWDSALNNYRKADAPISISAESQDRPILGLSDAAGQPIIAEAFILSGP